jgi:hypothetical protein
MFIFVLTRRYKIPVYVYCNGNFQHVDKQTLLKMVIYWPKLLKNNKLKHQHLSFTLDGVLQILFEKICICFVLDLFAQHSLSGAAIARVIFAPHEDVDVVLSSVLLLLHHRVQTDCGCIQCIPGAYSRVDKWTGASPHTGWCLIKHEGKFTFIFSRNRRSQWPRVVRHKPSSPARTLG